MDIRTLQYFLAVAEAGSISAAAKKLHISQPPLSMQIKMLESELGVVLMERGPRNIRLTEAGKLLYLRGKSIIDFADLTIREVRDFGSGTEGTVRVGVASSCGPLLLPIIRRFQKKYPSAAFQLSEKNTYELLDMLDNNLIEVAIVRTPFEKSVGHKGFLIAQDHLIAVGKSVYFENAVSPLALQALESKPLIVYRRWEPIITELFKKAQLPPYYYCINDDARTSLQWALGGMGIAMLPSSITPAVTGEDIVSYPIAETQLKTGACVIWKGTGYISPVTKNFLSLFDPVD